MRGEIAYKFERQKRLLFLRRVFLAIIVFAVSTAAVFYGAGRLFRLSNIEIAGNERVNTDDLRSQIKQTLSQNSIPLWPEENIIFFNSESLAEALKKQFAAIDAVDISRDIWRKSLTVEVKERNTWAVWCQHACFYVDGGGILFEPAPQFLGDLILKIIDERSDNFSLGDRIMDLKTLSGVQKFAEQIKKNSGLSVKNIRILPETELWLDTDGDFKIVLDPETDFDRAYENLAIFLKSAAEEKINEIDYIDLRFQDKTFYRSLPVF
ncbi:MAG: FtsQ-type POTRA domain-containing protein [Patescibacteria group bacterium]